MKDVSYPVWNSPEPNSYEDTASLETGNGAHSGPQGHTEGAEKSEAAKACR